MKHLLTPGRNASLSFTSTFSSKEICCSSFDFWKNYTSVSSLRRLTLSRALPFFNLSWRTQNSVDTRTLTEPWVAALFVNGMVNRNYDAPFSWGYKRSASSTKTNQSSSQISYSTVSYSSSKGIVLFLLTTPLSTETTPATVNGSTKTNYKLQTYIYNFSKRYCISINAGRPSAQPSLSHTSIDLYILANYIF